MTSKNQLRQSIILLLFFSSLASLNAQIVSLNEPRTKNPKKGIQGDVQLTLNYTENKKRVLQNGTKFNLQLNDSLSTYLFYSDLRLSRTDGVNDLNYGSFGTIYNYKAEDRIISAEALMQYQYDGNKNLKHRFIMGGGPRWKVVDKKGLKLSLVAYTIYFNEKYESANVKSQAKFSTMLTFSTSLSPNMSIKHNTYYEPDYANPSDYRIESQTSFKAKFNKNFSYSVHFRLNYNSMVPTGIDNYDYRIQNALSFSF